MGRKNTKHLNLPKGMRARVRQRKQGNPVVYYFYDTGGKPRREISLGTDYVLAVKQWAELEGRKQDKSCKPTFSYLVQRFLEEVAPSKSQGTANNYRRFSRKLLEFFGSPDANLADIEPVHIRQYLDWRRDSPHSANNEVALFSTMWNHAREWGYTDKPNPCAGVKKYPTAKRSNYIEDHLYNLVYQAADQQMKDMMDLAYITGQRPSDVVKIHTTHIHNGVLYITQQKTKAKVRFEVTGLLKEIIERNTPDGGGFLFHNQRGGKMTSKTLGSQFTAIRKRLQAAHPEIAAELENFQFRDLRAKSGTDTYLQTDNIEAAQKRLGHTSSQMTKTYIRKEKTLKPLK